MNLNIFLPLDLNKTSQLKFIERTVPFMFREVKDGPIIFGAVHTVSYDTAKKLVETFSGKDDVKVNTGDKVYVFPGCKIPQFKIKEALKEMGAKFTSSYEDATVFLGSENAFKDDIQQVNFSVNLLGGEYYNSIQEYTDVKEDMAPEFHEGKYPSLYNNARKFYARAGWGSTIAGTEMYFKDDGTFLNKFYMLTILGAEILYRKLSQKIPVISEEAFLKQLSPTCTIDHEMYQSLDDMLESKDPNDNQLALQTIANCDIKASFRWIYPLIIYHFDKFNNSRFKNIKLFNQMIKLDEINKLPVRDFIIELMKEGPDNISKQVARQLFDIEADIFIGIDSGALKSDLFDIILVPKQKFKQIVPDLTYKYELDDE